MAAISLIVIANGPERLVERTRAIAARHASPSTEVVIVAAGSMTPGAARNEGVRRSAGNCFLVADGSDPLATDYMLIALRALDANPGAVFAAAPGSLPFVGAPFSQPGREAACIDASALVGSAWSLGPAVIRRAAFDEVGGFDESLPVLVDWDFLLALTDAGKFGVISGGSSSRYTEDDVRLRETLAVSSHLPAVRTIFAKHQATFETHMRASLLERERTAKALFQHERALLERRAATLVQLDSALEEITALRPELAKHGLRTLDFGDLRSTAPVSRSWGGERGVPVDRYYIHQFLREHADDVRGQVLEMLDAELTTAFGGGRVERSDILDIDPGNARATLIADLRAPEQLPTAAYDCFILTQTLHLIDDMTAAVKSACRALKPGGVLLATLPCASMVATQYGARGDHWRVTEAGARALFERVFDPAGLTIRARGNVLTITAFLHGLCCDDIDAGEFAVDDPAYPLLITVRAEKAAAAPRIARGVAPAAAVLQYHRIADVTHDIHGLAVSPAAFRAQVEHLRKSWNVMPLRELAAAAANGEPPDRAVALTFDDGYLDNLETAAPILAELGLPATFFLTTETGAGCRRFWWDVLEDALASDPAAHSEWYARFKRSVPVVRDDMLAQLARQTGVPLVSKADRPMTFDEMRRLRDFPLIDIGAHSVHHVSLAHLSAVECHSEVFESRSALERLTGRPVTSFAYPFGETSPDAMAAVIAAGFQDAVTCEGRGLRSREHRLRIPRVVAREESGAELGTRIGDLR